MFEKLVAWVLNTYIGEYVDDLNTDKLSVGIMKGQVELGNLPLKTDALRSLDMPIEVKSGFIGRIRLVIPWKSLNSAPWVITLEDLCLVAGPINKSHYDEAHEKKSELERKKAQLQTLEDKWQVEKQISPQSQAGGGGGGGWGLWGYGASLAAMGYNIVENLQLEVKNVHIRYEDSTTVPGSSFACGFTIDVLSAHSTDASWIPKFVSRTNMDIMHKLADLKELALYWDINCALLAKLKGKELLKALQKADHRHSYILEPVTAEAKMKRNLTALNLKSLNSPRINLDIQMEVMAFGISDAQFKGMAAWLREYNRFDKARRYRKWRPRNSLHGHAKEWWNYAIQSQLHFIHDRNRRLSKDYMLSRARDSKLYVEAYTEKLTVGEYYMDKTLKLDLERIEEEWSFECLKVLRQIVMKKLSEEGHYRQPIIEQQAVAPRSNASSGASTPSPSALSPTQQSTGYLHRWFPGWSGWYGGAGANSDTGQPPPPPPPPPPLVGHDGFTTPPESAGSPVKMPPPPPPMSPEQIKVEQEIEQELASLVELPDSAENNTLLKRDALFARVNFCLQSGTFKLLQQDTGSTSSLLEVEASTIKMSFESRPRTQGLKYSVSVAGWFLTDKMTQNSIMPVLIAPQQKERQTWTAKGVGGSLLGNRGPSILTPSAMFRGQQNTENTSLFELTFEKNPMQSSADYRLDIKTKPLDIVYNPVAIKRVKEFFTVKDPEDWPKTDMELAVAAKARYELLKKQTQAELRHTLDNFLEGEEQIKAKRWDFSLDISALQIIVPECFTDQNATLVVFDLGHLQFHNMAAGVQTEHGRVAHRDSDEADEDFVTPSSTPPNESENGEDIDEGPGEKDEKDDKAKTDLHDIFSELSAVALHDKIYDKYLMNLTELQVMVGQPQDKWKYARTKGTSTMHVVDKFSINLQFERRLLYTSDPQFPKSSLSGTLPSLSLHVGEHKLKALQQCVSQLSASSPTEEEFPSEPTVDPQKEQRTSSTTNSAGANSIHVTSSEEAKALEEQAEQEQKAAEEQAESKSMLAQFSINHASLDVQSRGRSIAELQVSAVRAQFTRRPLATSMSLSIHSLLVVDALQTFGKDFELPVASHKNLCLDSRSGSIYESNPNSPQSPQSPMSPSSPAEPVFPSAAPARSSTSFSAQVQGAVTNALQGLVAPHGGAGGTGGSSVSSQSASPSSSLNASGFSGWRRQENLLPLVDSDEEALIKVELDIIKPDARSPTDDSGGGGGGGGSRGRTMHIANVIFNSLDFVANQHTLVELLSFMQRISPAATSPTKSSKQTSRAEKMQQQHSMDISQDEEPAEGVHWEVTADFNRLNVLLMRVEEREKKFVARKVATATMSDAKFQGRLGGLGLGQLEVEGSLGGLQLLDLTSDEIVRRSLQTVLSVGLDPAASSTHHMAHFRPPDSLMYKTINESQPLLLGAGDKALNFQMRRGPSDSTLSQSMVIGSSGGGGGGIDAMDVNLRMATLLYTHSPTFLKDLSQCLTEFKDYMSGVGSTIRDAATEVAMGLVNHPDKLGQSLYGSMTGLDSPMPKTVESAQGIETNKPLQLRLDAQFQTPVIFFPRAPKSSQVLVAHLGKIAITNSSQPVRTNLESTAFGIEEDHLKEKLFIEIRDMSMYSTDLEKQEKPRVPEASSTASPFNLTKDQQQQLTTSVFSTPQPGGFIRTSYGTPILHDTVIELSVEKLTVPLNQTMDEDELQFNVSPLHSLDDENTATTKSRKQSTSALMQVTGRVVTPLKLTLSKHVYEQILNTLDNIAPPDDIPEMGYSSPRVSLLPDIYELSESLEPSDSNIEDATEASPEKSEEKFEGLSSASSQIPDSNLVIRANFEMPVFNILMTGDLGDLQGEQGLVDIKLQDFRVIAEKADPYTKTLEVELKSLLMEDLLQEPNSKHRLLMASFKPEDVREEKQCYLSSSCPTSNIDLPDTVMPSSLPSRLNKENVFEANQAAKPPTTKRSNSNRDCPVTPPPTPLVGGTPRRGSLQQDGQGEKLVCINVKLVDKKSPEFVTKYNSTQRFVDVAFSSLDSIVNLQTWVMLLDYLGMGAKVHDPAQYSQHQMKEPTPVPSNAEPENEPVNTEVDLKIKSFALVFNKNEYEFLRASIDSFKSHVSLRDGNFAIKGQLGGLSVRDQSPHGSLYGERFITTGTHALDFDVFKYGFPDPDLARAYDISVKLQMASARYVHTQRFVAETLGFLQHFNQLQVVLGRMAAKAGWRMAEDARIKLDIEAGAPIVLVPHSARSTDVLCLDMGTLSISNTFLFSGTPGTILQEKQQRQREEKERREQTAESTPMPSGSSMADSMMMNQSIYGSLDADYRSSEMASPLETVMSSMISDSMPDVHQFGSDVNGGSASVLNSLYSALGSPESDPSSTSLHSSHSQPSQDQSKEEDADREEKPRPAEVSEEEESEHVCLVDVMHVALVDMEVFSAEWRDIGETAQPGDLSFPSFLLRRQAGNMLREKCKLTLQVERNLEGDISHEIPDFQVSGKLTPAHFLLDLSQYQLVKGLLAHNFGEPLEEFQKPLMSHLQDPKIQTVLSGEVWRTISISLQLDDVVAELLLLHASPTVEPVSLAKWDFIRSTLSFESYSNGSKDIDLVSHEIMAYDTRYKDAPANARPSVFSKILQPTVSAAAQTPPSPSAPAPATPLQMELHFRSTKDNTRFIVLLNNMRLMGVLDWLLPVKDFLLTEVEDPWKQAPSHSTTPSPSAAGHGGAGGKHQVTPLALSTGILTTFELKLNVTDTEFVVVEDTSAWDTNAVILKSTAMLCFRPSHRERPLSCTLLSLEVFSCSLAAEEETAFSIIDPMTVTIEMSGSQPRALAAPSTPPIGPPQRGLLDATGDKPPVLEVQFSSLNIRLSYNDLKLFRAIMSAMPQQLTMATQPKNLQPQASDQLLISAVSVSQLIDLGFARPDCERALRETRGRVDEAALWLTANSTPVPVMSGKQNPGTISGLEVKAGNICVCVIDDCLDADVPLVELTFSAVNFMHKLDTPMSGQASFRLAVDYYNRSLSGWEPCLEQWGTTVLWNRDQHGKMAADIKAADLLKVNLTGTLLEQYQQTKAKWADDLTKHSQQERQGLGIVCSRRRVPFIPFAIRNHTGCKLYFATVTTTPTRIPTAGDHFSQNQHDVSSWRQVNPGDELPFLIEERHKIRHKHTHELKVHQLAVRVEGWKEITPVSVNKVGVYFRQAQPQETAASILSELPSARIVFDVGIEGSARKVITIRSALMLDNELDEKVEVKLENTLPYAEARNHSIEIPPASKMPVPLPFVHSRMWVRPKNCSLDYCNKPILWQHVNRTGRPGESSHLRLCDTIGGEHGTYRFCVSVVRQPYPIDPIPLAAPSTASSSGSHKPHVYAQPGHVISLLPPVRVVNLLPIDLNYYLKDTQLRGTVKPGQMAPLVTADLRQALELGITLENFPTCKELVIPPGTRDYKVKLRLYDTQDRKLELWVHIKAGLGGSLRLYISVPYWLVNKSGLPLIFRQDGSTQAAAGQFEEHELARSVVPLLFSYSDKELTKRCNMRVKKSVHGRDTSHPKWCSRFSLESGIGFRPLHVAPHSNRPDWVYNIGIEVRQGRGRYCDTNIVTFSPRYQLDNRSSHKLAFAQKHMADKGQNPGSSDILYALPSCKLSYHWPRVDLDQLLCARPMDTHCDWSGGFRIDLVNSFHISMRGSNGECQFLRIDIVLQGATFFIVFTDAHEMPPPYRLDNFSEVAITYFQTKVTDEKLRTQIKPRTSVPYAWDEPTLPPHISLSVPGGSSATYNMDVVGNGEQLYYQNFIYLAMSATFKRLSPTHGGAATLNSFVESQCLVLEGNPQTCRVTLKKKEAGNRFQLWRMTGQGMLQHEGSSVPQDPKHKSSSSSSRSSSSSSSAVYYVLDIADIAIQPGHDVALVLRKQDPRRKSTQTWRFMDNGRLCCGSSQNMCVQARDGMFGMREGGEAILGSAPGPSAPLPAEHRIERQRMRPGSGMLAVKVLSDLPTRVLQIMDIKQQRYRSQLSGSMSPVNDWVMVEEAQEAQELSTTDDGDEVNTDSTAELDVHVKLSAGIGISVVSKLPEELLFITLSDIDIDYSTNSHGQTVEVAVKHMQIDNQLLGCSRPVLLYATPAKTDDPSASQQQHKPAVCISTHKMPSQKWNATIFSHLLVHIKRMTLQIEEALLWKLVQFLQMEKKMDDVEESGFDTQRALTAATSSHFKRYYFGTLKLSTGRLLLSMLTAADLPPDLVYIKRSMAIPLIKFEDAKVKLDPFSRLRLFETVAFLQENIMMHYTKELKSQAAKILGSVDFLGNPLGLFNDVTEGLSGLLKDGNIGGLVKNVAHGVSDSTAKVTGSVSDGLGVMSSDESYQRRRQAIRDQGSSAGHLVAGVKGLGYGLFGGLTSIVSQTYTGVRDDGYEGLFTGISKGVVGTVTKPVMGVLDFAAASASAIRDTSRGRSRKSPPRCRRPRCCYGPGGLLPQFSEHHALAQELLYSLNGHCFNEMFIAYEQLRFREDTLRALISSDQVFLLGGDDSNKLVMNVTYDQLFHCRALPYDKKYFIELSMKSDTERGVASDVKKKRLLVRCDSEAIARKVAQHINYAKNLYDERRPTLPELIIQD